jgi:putative membrane protein
MWAWMSMAGVMVLAFWVLLIAGGVLAVRALVRGSGDQPTRQPTALDILQARYARGEIGAEEYHRMREDLRA